MIGDEYLFKRINFSFIFLNLEELNISLRGSSFRESLFLCNVDFITVHIMTLNIFLICGIMECVCVGGGVCVYVCMWVGGKRLKKRL